MATVRSVDATVGAGCFGLIALAMMELDWRWNSAAERQLP